MSPPSGAAAKVERARTVFSALGDETRMALVARLSAGGPQSITQLTTRADVTRQAITKHLDVLASAGLVKDSRRGRERIWELDPTRLTEAGRTLDQISRRWDEALDSLRKFVED
ncbi:MAG: metalloregulator ArsR/SmtB family transcription factor [Acidobacteriota bacterium]|nr:metalloregulator ArsR/SmtB family transcription factor [Acidobacteriota bacterium]